MISIRCYYLVSFKQVLFDYFHSMLLQDLLNTTNSDKIMLLCFHTIRNISFQRSRIGVILHSDTLCPMFNTMYNVCAPMHPFHYCSSLRHHGRFISDLFIIKYKKANLSQQQISKLDPDSPVREGHLIVTVFKKHRWFLFRILISNNVHKH